MSKEETPKGKPELTVQSAISVLIQAARIGQEKGAYTLEDARVIMDAIDLFQPKESKKDEDSSAENTETEE